MMGGKADGGLRSVMNAKLKPFGDFQAIETGMISGGVPDINFCINGREGWIECKRTSGWVIPRIEGSQVAWAERRVRAGGRVWCAVRRLNEKTDELWLLRHSAMRPLLLKARLNALAPDLVLGVWVNGPAAWDWPRVAALLSGDKY